MNRLPDNNHFVVRFTASDGKTSGVYERHFRTRREAQGFVRILPNLDRSAKPLGIFGSYVPAQAA